MYANQEDVFYYLTLMNENYTHPAMPKGAEEGIIKGMYLLSQTKGKAKQPHVQLMGSGTILRESISPPSCWLRTLAPQWTYGALPASLNCAATVWIASDGIRRIRKPTKIARQLCRTMHGKRTTCIATTDYMRSFAHQIRGWLYLLASGDGDAFRYA